MNEEDVRQKMLDIVGDIYNAKFVEHGLNGYTKFDGHTLDEAKYTINKAFDRLEPDHPKVKLPREVGEELDKYKQRGNETYDLIFDLTTYSEELEETSRYIPYDSMIVQID
ncbi:hypothetical protein [Lacticaseibacillus manihotivorans]|uniref:hypothetical protein n=1 Tax=Lacticaseibacillus manihotivorans TaxID=88233 RepID=UPI0006CFE21C|nr:hypothetical protein [Lacticaseibacillus manihotivorans]